MIANEQPPTLKKGAGKFHRLLSNDFCRSDEVSREQGPRVALLTPYTGNNLGDAAILDAMIANLRLRLSDAQFSGISFSCESFVERHGGRAFPLCGSDRPFHSMSRGYTASKSVDGESFAKGSGQIRALLKRTLRRVPVLGAILSLLLARGSIVWQEFCHCVEGYHFLRTQDLLIVCGGGQLDEEWGGPWGHPFTLFKWAVLARIARIPYVIASVGACKVSSTTSRFFLSSALRMARYRSYRDKHSREIAAGILKRAAGDSVVSDLAFSLPASELPPSAGIRSLAQGRTVAAISPMAYARPQSWPYPDRALYDRYLHQMAQVVSKLLERNYFLIIVRSALSDGIAIQELLSCLDDESKRKLDGQMYIPAITAWKDLIATLLDADLVVASRLHSAILSFVANRPTIAISFDPKVDWVMEDLGQAHFLLQIRDFSAEDVIEALDRIDHRRGRIAEQIDSYKQQALSNSAIEYDALARFAIASNRCH